jgi:hypothetical protein
MDEEHRYTVEEADAVLDDLRVRLERIRETRQVILRAAKVIREGVASDGGGHEGKEYWEATASLKADVEHLAALGILLRDPETGLVDFPSEREGRPVYLCWRLGEERISHWHDLESGFAGRKPL